MSRYLPFQWFAFFLCALPVAFLFCRFFVAYRGCRLAERPRLFYILTLYKVHAQIAQHRALGHLGDHYDQQAKAARLTAGNYAGHSLTAITVAAHEVGHALQDARGEALFKTRQRLVSAAVRGERVAGIMLVAAPLTYVADSLASLLNLGRWLAVLRRQAQFSANPSGYWGLVGIICPYRLIYRVTRDALIVTAVYHQRQHPRSWQNRVQEPMPVYAWVRRPPDSIFRGATHGAARRLSIGTGHSAGR